MNIIIGDSEEVGKSRPSSVVFHLDGSLRSSISTPYNRATKDLNGMRLKYCNTMLNSTAAVTELQRAHVVVGDSVYQCSNLVAAKFSLLHVVVARRLFYAELIGYGILNPPSYVPSESHPFAEVTGLIQRAQNAFSRISSYRTFFKVMCPLYEGLKTKFNITPHESMAETLSRVDLILVQLDFPIEVPRPLLPSKS